MLPRNLNRSTGLSLALLCFGFAFAACFLPLNVGAARADISLALALSDYNLEETLEADKLGDHFAPSAFFLCFQTNGAVFHNYLSNPSNCKSVTIVLTAPRSPPVR